MPLTEAVEFKTRLQKGNRVQVPRLVRWRFKLEPSEVLRITVTVGLRWSNASESFYGRMGKDGRITVPLLVLDLLEKKADTGEGLTGQVLEVRIAPAERLPNSEDKE